MERMGTTPISSATKTGRRGSARSTTKPPVGPLNVTGSPGLEPADPLRAETARGHVHGKRERHGRAPGGEAML